MLNSTVSSAALINTMRKKKSCLCRAESKLSNIKFLLSNSKTIDVTKRCRRSVKYFKVCKIIIIKLIIIN